MPEYLANHAFIASVALLVHLLFATRRLYAGNPLGKLVRFPSQALQWLERKLNRSNRSLRNRRMRGYAVTIAALLLSLLKAWLFLWIISQFYFGSVLEVLLVGISLSFRPAVDRALHLHKQLQIGNLSAAREALSGSAWRNYPLLDAHACARAMIEKLQVDFSERLFAALFWYVIAGLPGLFILWAMTMLSENLSAHRDHFGRASVQLDKWLQWLPGRLCALLLALASCFVVFGRARHAFVAATTPEMRIPSRQYILATSAYALGLTLGGPADVYLHPPVWVGDGKAMAEPEDIIRCLMLLGIAAAVMLLMLLSLG